MKRAAAALLVVAVAALAWIAYRHLSRPPPPSPEVAASGTLTAVATVQVGAPAAGEVKEVMVDFNTPVRRGQVLARLGPAPERAGAPPQDEERSLVRAPIDGTVILRNVAPGQTVATGAQAPALFTIAPDLREMQLQATIAAADAARLRVGMQATLTVEAFPRRTFTGEVRQIRKSAPRGQPASYTVVLDAANPELALLPGMTAQARIAVEPAR